MSPEIENVCRKINESLDGADIIDAFAALAYMSAFVIHASFKEESEEFIVQIFNEGMEAALSDLKEASSSIQ